MGADGTQIQQLVPIPYFINRIQYSKNQKLKLNPAIPIKTKVTPRLLVERCYRYRRCFENFLVNFIGLRIAPK